jgi:hypothetical protein
MWYVIIVHNRQMTPPTVCGPYPSSLHAQEVRNLIDPNRKCTTHITGNSLIISKA